MLSGETVRLVKTASGTEVLEGISTDLTTSFSGFLLSTVTDSAGKSKLDQTLRLIIHRQCLRSVGLAGASYGFSCSVNPLTMYCPDSGAINVQSAYYGSYASTCNDTCCAPNLDDDCLESMEDTAPLDWAVLLECSGRNFCQVPNPGQSLGSCPEIPTSDYTIVNYACGNNGIR